MPYLTRGPVERELKKLIELFLRAETEIINEIMRLRSRGLVDYHAVAALQRVQAILKKLENDCWEYVPRMIEMEFYVNHPEARTPLVPPETPEKHLRGYQNAFSLTSEETDIVQKLTMNLMGQITEAAETAEKTVRSGLGLIGRLEPDVFRRTGLEAAAISQAKGRGVYASLNDFVEAMRREGVTAFVDKAGRNWNLHNYGSMSLRTTRRQAQVLAVLTRNPGHDLYKISSHKTTCPLCAPYEGRVYSKSGKDPDFPPLAAAFGKIKPDGPDDLSNTYLTIHPNCLHQLIRWTPAGRSEEEIEEIKEFSSFEKNPPSVDPRTEKQIKAYRDKVRARARELSDRRQFERYKDTLGGKVPKTLETFKRHKYAVLNEETGKREPDEKFKLWQLDYRRQSDLLRYPEKALPYAGVATAADEKFTKYFFNPQNSSGYNKGVAFTSRLGYNADNWQEMREEILAAARKYPALYKSDNEQGKRYTQDVILYGKKGKPANIRLGWLVENGGGVHLTTAHMEEF